MAQALRGNFVHSHEKWDIEILEDWVLATDASGTITQVTYAPPCVLIHVVCQVFFWCWGRCSQIFCMCLALWRHFHFSFTWIIFVWRLLFFNSMYFQSNQVENVLSYWPLSRDSKSWLLSKEISSSPDLLIAMHMLPRWVGHGYRITDKLWLCYFIQ